jgi:hypothetical protein
MTVAQGWYADPWDAAHYRWWDGIAWTDHRQPMPVPEPVAQAVAPVAVVASAIPVVVAPQPQPQVQRERQRQPARVSGPDLRSRVAAQCLLEKLAELQAIGDFALDADYRKVRISAAARPCYLGALGERRVAKLLAQLGPEWTVLHSVPVGSSTSDIDHVVIGPGGVFAINSKNHSGATISVRARGLMVNGDKQHYLSNTVTEAERAAARLGEATGLRVPVTGVLAFVGVKKLDIKEAPRALTVALALWHDHELVTRLTAASRVLNAQQVAAIVAVASDARTWHTRPKAPRDMRDLERDFELLERGVDHHDRRAATARTLRSIFLPLGFAAACYGAYLLWTLIH